MKKLFKKGKKWILGLAMAIAVLGSTIGVNAISWPGAILDYSNVVNTNYPNAGFKVQRGFYGKGELYATSDRNFHPGYIEWYSWINNDSIPGMSKPLGEQSYTKKKNFIWTDTFNYNPVDIDEINLYTPVFLPMCLDEEYCQATKNFGGWGFLNDGKPNCGTTDMEECYYRASNGTPTGSQLNWKISEVMDKLTQNDGETLAQFKARVAAKPMSYGIFAFNGETAKNSEVKPNSIASNSQTLIINFGDIGNNGLNIKDAYVNYSIGGQNYTATGNEIYEILADMITGKSGIYNNTGAWSEFKENFPGNEKPEGEEMDKVYDLLVKYYKDVYGPDNVTGGNVTWFAVNTKVSYDISGSTFGNGSGNAMGLMNYPSIEYQVEENGVLKDVKKGPTNSQSLVLYGPGFSGPIQGKDITAAEGGHAKLYLFDRTYSYPGKIVVDVNGDILDTRYFIPAIENAEFALEIKDDDDEWQRVASNLVTDKDGLIDVPVAAAGTYRFVQTKSQDDSNYVIPWDLRKSCLSNIRDNGSPLYDPLTAANNTFKGTQKVGCQWDEKDKVLASKEFTISASQGANAYIPNIIDPYRDIYYDLDGGVPAPAAGMYNTDYLVGSGYAEGYFIAGKQGGPYPPTREGYEFVGWCQTKTVTNGVEHGQDCGYEDTGDDMILIPKAFDAVDSIPTTYNWDVYLKAMWKSKVATPLPPGIAYVDGNDVDVNVDLISGKVTVQDINSLKCDEKLKPTTPEVPNVSYTVTKISDDGVYPELYKVVAVLDADYTLYPSDARTEWTVEIPEIKACPTEKEVTPILPEILDSDGKNVAVEKTVDGELVLTVDPVECDKDYTLKVPGYNGTTDEEGLIYTVEDLGNNKYKVTVKADEDNNYVLAENSVTEWIVIIPEKEACPVDKEVTPEEPTLDKNVDCEVDYKLTIPTMEGVKYTEAWNGKVVTITATAKEGYVIAPGAKTEWIFDTTNVNLECGISEITPIAPALDKNVPCEVDYMVVLPNQTGVIYTKGEVVNGKVIVTAKPAEGYTLTGQTEWTLDVNNSETCPVEPIKVTPKAPTLDKKVKCEVDFKVVIPTQEGVEYTKTQNGKVVKVVATAKEGYVLAGQSEWTFDVTNSEKCPVTPPTTGPGTGPGTGTPGTGTPGTTNPTKPLPGTGSELMSMALISLIGAATLGFVGYRRSFK